MAFQYKFSFRQPSLDHNNDIRMILRIHNFPSLDDDTAIAYVKQMLEENSLHIDGYVLKRIAVSLTKTIPLEEADEKNISDLDNTRQTNF